VTPRTRLTAAERREQLLDATKAIVAEQGFHAVSIEAVARAAQISRPIVYHHFDGLERLLLALLDRETSRALEQLAERLTGEGPLAAFGAYLDAVEADPVTWSLVLVAPEGMPEALRGEIRAWRARFAAGIAAGLPGPDPELTGRMLQTMADEGCRLLLAGEVTKKRLLAQAERLLSALSAAS
jgi:AcrR family transcriptional regulator